MCNYQSFFIISFLMPGFVFAQCAIRVLLQEGDICQGLEWQFITHKKSFLCAFDNGSLVCNGKKLPKNALRISSDDGRCSYKDGVYAGDIALIIYDQKWYVINTIDLDEYVYSVLRSESWPGWPLEVNKAFAIMVRTYAVHKIILTKSMKKRTFFDIKSTNIHQTYKGIHNFEHLHQAVDETHDVIISYNKQPIVAMYDSCCGGIVPEKLTGLDFKANPYLARSYACTYCDESKLYNWKIVYSHDQLMVLLHKEFPDIKSCKDIRVSSVDAAGKVLEVTVKYGRTHKKISGTLMYKICKDVRSFCYTIYKDGKDIVFEGKGFGHHVGVCQWGVRTMAKKGFSYKQMLEFYYPGTKLMKLVSEHAHAAT